VTDKDDAVTVAGDSGSGLAESGRATFGQRLRRRREEAGLSQVALAGADLHPSYVSLLESDRRSPTTSIVKVLAARLGILPEQLTGDVVEDLGAQLLLADAAVSTGRPAEAVSLLEEVVTRLRPDRLAADPKAFRAGHVYATALERSGRLEDATTMWERLRAVAETAPGRLPWLPVVGALVRCYREAGDLSRAVDLGEAALRRYGELHLEGLDGHSALVSSLAGTYSERGDHLRAKVILDDLIAQTERSGSLDDRGYAYWNAAVTAAERGQVGEGMRLADRAAALLSVGDDVRSRARLQVTRAWLLLAERPPDAAAARRILRAALPEVRQHAGALSVASAETELARCELLLGRADVARRLAQSALKRLHEEHRLERARALTALGAALVASGETAAGVAELEEAAQTLKRVEAPRQAAAVWRQLSETLRSLGDPAGALEAADRAMDGAGLAHEPLTPSTTPAAGTGRARARRAHVR
jgi:tetratricopeptide (TPR) repeat protein